MNRLLTSTLALILASQATADEGRYLIQCELSQGERVLGTPAIVATSGKKAKMSVSDTYSLSLVARGGEGDLVQLSTQIVIDGETYSPDVIVYPDQATKVRIGDITFTVKVSRLSDEA